MAKRISWVFVWGNSCLVRVLSGKKDRRYWLVRWRTEITVRTWKVTQTHDQNPFCFGVAQLYLKQICTYERINASEANDEINVRALFSMDFNYWSVSPSATTWWVAVCYSFVENASTDRTTMLNNLNAVVCFIEKSRTHINTRVCCLFSVDFVHNLTRSIYSNETQQPFLAAFGWLSGHTFFSAATTALHANFIFEFDPLFGNSWQLLSQKLLQVSQPRLTWKKFHCRSQLKITVISKLREGYQSMLNLVKYLLRKLINMSLCFTRHFSCFTS